MRVQPHLKKCFEGIYSLVFDENDEITGVISCDNEIVPLDDKINPAEAKVKNLNTYNQSVNGER